MARLTFMAVIVLLYGITSRSSGQEPERLTAKALFWKEVPREVKDAAVPRGYEGREEEIGVRGHLVPQSDGSAFLLTKPEHLLLRLHKLGPDRKVTWQKDGPEGERRFTWCGEEPSASICGDGRGNVLFTWIGVPTDKEARRGVRDNFLMARLFDGAGKVAWTATLALGRCVERYRVAFWPGQGWLITWATIGPDPGDHPDDRKGWVRAQVLALDGARRCGENGLALGRNNSPFGINPVFTVRDTPRSMFLLWHDFTVDRYRAQRLGPDGRPLWKAPVSVAEGMGDFLRRREHEDLKLSVTADGKVRAVLYTGTANDIMEDMEQITVLVGADGKVKEVARKRVDRNRYRPR